MADNEILSGAASESAAKDAQERVGTMTEGLPQLKVYEAEARTEAATREHPWREPLEAMADAYKAQIAVVEAKLVSGDNAATGAGRATEQQAQDADEAKAKISVDAAEDTDGIRI